MKSHGVTHGAHQSVQKMAKKAKYPIFGQRPWRELEGTKFCNKQGKSVHLCLCPSIRPSVHTHAPLEAPQRLAHTFWRLA